MTDLYSIAPDRPLAPRIDRVSNATIIPVDNVSNPKRNLLGGILREDGSYVENSACFIDQNRSPTKIPSASLMQNAPRISGNWLFGGRFDLRFGHFLVETMARLWALDHLPCQIRGVAYIPATARAVRNPDRVINKGRPLYDLIEGLPTPMLVTTPTRFETLFVPPQGCGAGALAMGCPEFRTFMELHFKRGNAERPPSKLYISRTGLSRTPGQIVHEHILESALKQEGYEVFHPEQHSLDDQIERIRSAAVIVGVEGSAFHMVSYAAAPRSRIAVIRRRNSDNGILLHCQAFHKDRVYDISAVHSHFVTKGSRHPIGNTVLDFQKVREQLVDNGFVSQDFQLPIPSSQEVQRGIDELNRRILGG